MPPDTQGLPWPEGEPGEIRAAARRAAALGAALSDESGSVLATNAPGWSGSAAASFDGTVQIDGSAVLAAANAFTESAGSLEELAAAVERAQDRVREAARRLREAREAAAAAEARAVEARAAADRAQAAAMFDPATALTSPLFTEASAAQDAAWRAESEAATARDELARVEAWARREADDAVSDARAADQRTAGVLDAAAGGPGGARTSMPGGLGPLGGYLNADLFNYWGGGPDGNTFPLGKLIKGGTFMYGTVQWLRAQSVAASWARVAPSAPGTFTELTAMNALARFPTFNNGLVGRGLARGMSALPRLEGAGSWLSNASRATPIFRRLGIAGGVYSTVTDGYNLIQQGNPVDAFQRDGAGYVADVGRTAFSASTTAFLIAPNPVTGGAVVVSGAVWAGAEIYQHREAIGHAIGTGADWAWDHSAAGVVWNNREEIGQALDSGVDMVGDGLSTVADTGGDLIDGAGDLVSSIPTPW
ncbi:MAG TPA: hypothetical protein VFX51_19555 [Solirubrobacteraceae bacterium]|nr:hypothetical protein [Solirubrobacteraceae bacterium]